MNVYLGIIVAVMVGNALLQLWVNRLNIGHVRVALPEEFEGWYDATKYRRSQEYLLANTRFENLGIMLTVPVMLLFLLAGGLGWIDGLARLAGGGVVVTGLIFTAVWSLLNYLLNLPFDLYDTFVIEERFGFNRTKAATFIADQLKLMVLAVLLGGPLLAAVLWFFSSAGPWGWLIAWAVMVAFQLLMTAIGPSLLLPLFNTFTPLAEGDLKSAIEDYAGRQQVSLAGIFTMDGSRRSSKANAYVIGLGRLKRIVLYDTLVERHTVPELVAVLAHEVGHAKRGHVRKMLVTSIITTGVMFFLLSLFISSPGLYAALQVDWPAGSPAPLYAAIMAFGILMTPLSRLLSIYTNYRSRCYEFEADAFAAGTTGDAEPLITALKRLSVDNFSNLSPHPLMVRLDYSHPPVLERIKALRAAGATPA